MRLTVLGAGPAYTNREGSTGACYLVEQDGTHLLLDLGQGSFPRIFRHVAPEDVDAVVISHLHPDHFIDLVPMRHYLRYYLEPPRAASASWGRPTSRPGRFAPRPAGVHRRGIARRRRSAPGPTGSGASRSRRASCCTPMRATRSGSRRTPAARASCTAATAAAPTTSRRWSGRATCCSPRRRSGRSGARGRAAPRRAGGRAAGDGDPGRPRAAHPPPDGPRPGRDDRVLPGAYDGPVEPGLARNQFDL